MIKKILLIPLLASLSIFVTSCNDIKEGGNLNPEKPPAQEQPPEDSNSDEANFDQMTIANWDYITSVGAGLFNQPLEEANPFYATENNTITLLGMTESGDVIPLTFLDENEQVVQMDRHLIGLTIMENFIFAEFAPHWWTISYEIHQEMPDFRRHSPPNQWELFYAFAISTRTGNVFFLNDLGKTFTLTQWRDSYQEMHNSFYFRSFSWNINSSDASIWRMTEIDNELVVERVIELRLLPLFREFVVDYYGNIFSMITENNEQHQVLRNPNANSDSPLLRTIPNRSLFLAPNNRVYAGEPVAQPWQRPVLFNEVFDENGELVSTDFIPPVDFNPSGIGKIPAGTNDSFLVNVDGGARYYYMVANLGRNGIWTLQNFDLRGPGGNAIGNHDPNAVHRFEFEDCGIIFHHERIEFDSHIASYWSSTAGNIEFVIENERLYFLNTDGIFHIEISTGELAVIETEIVLFFNAIWSDNLGTVHFSSISGETLETVYGIITSDNEVSLEVLPRSYRVFVLSPINQIQI